MKILSTALGITLLSWATIAEARDQIRVVGSSTVFSFYHKMLPKIFGRNTKFRTPIVESTGTGGGIKLWCSGLGESYPGVVNASRRIKDSEIELYPKWRHRNHRVEMGFDGIVIAQSNISTLQ